MRVWHPLRSTQMLPCPHKGISHPGIGPSFAFWRHLCVCVWEHGEPSAAWRANALESLHSLHSRSALHPPLFHVFFCLSSFAPRSPLLVGGPDWGRAVGSPLSCTSVADLGLRPDQNRAARSRRERRELFHVSGIGHAGLREAWRGCKQ